MPFIRGRYHINPIMGEALEAAREAATLALEHQSSDAHDQADGFASPHAGEHATERASSAPVHRIEIEASEMVPAHSGRAERSFVARVHRHPTLDANGDFASASHRASHSSLPAHSETQVFSNHRDLVNFLHDELSNDAAHR